MKVEELVEMVNSLGLTSPLWVDDIIKEPPEEVSKVDFDEHRWYVVATVVFRVDDGFVGIRGPVGLKSEMMGFDDVGMECKAFEMEEVSTVTYREKA
jgi:hypothetical protein